MKRYLFILLIILLSATSVFGAVSWIGTMGDMVISANASYTAVFYIDNVKLYNAWE